MTDFIDVDKDLGRFARESQRTIHMAHDLGWQVTWSGPNHYIASLRSPIEKSMTISVPQTNVAEKRVRSWIGKIRRYSDPEVLAEWLDRQEEAKQPVTATVTTAFNVEAPKGGDTPKEAHSLISEGPWMARLAGKASGRGLMYPSPVVVERHWSDGTVDYRCTHSDYTSPKPRSVASHAGKSHAGKGQHEAPRRVNDYAPSGIVHPSRRLVADLTRALDAVPDWKDLDAATLAERLAEVITASREPSLPTEPLTDAEVLNRIVTLVDRGRLAEATGQVSAMSIALAEVNKELDAARAEAQRLHDERAALRELLADPQKETTP